MGERGQLAGKEPMGLEPHRLLCYRQPWLAGQRELPQAAWILAVLMHQLFLHSHQKRHQVKSPCKVSGQKRKEKKKKKMDKSQLLMELLTGRQVSKPVIRRGE